MSAVRGVAAGPELRPIPMLSVHPGGVFLGSLRAQQGGQFNWAAESAASPYFSLFLSHFGAKPLG